MTVANSISLERDGNVNVVVISGEHDLSTVDVLRERLGAVLAEGRPFVIDLGAATFIDSAVLGVLVSTHDQAVAAGIPVGFVAGRSHTVRKIVDLTGLDAVLPIAPSRAGAVQAIAAAG